MKLIEIKYILLPWISKPESPMFGYVSGEGENYEWIREDDAKHNYEKRWKCLSFFRWVWISIIVSTLLGIFLINPIISKFSQIDVELDIKYDLTNYNYAKDKFYNGDYHVAVKYFDKCDVLPDSLILVKNTYLKKCYHIIDSVKSISDDIFKRESDSLKKLEEENFYKSRAGNIHKLHPEWSKNDCERLSQNYIWVGMDIEMVIYLRGKPNKINISNYGDGNRYQYIWRNYDIQYFHCGSNNIVTSYD